MANTILLFKVTMVGYAATKLLARDGSERDEQCSRSLYLARQTGAAGMIQLVVARARNGVIGRDGTLPWHLPEDLKRFKRLTLGTAMVMGRKTFDSLPGLLPRRRHIVVTRDRQWRAEGAEAVHSLPEAFALAAPDEVSIIGGAEIFRLALAFVDRIELTEVLAEVEGDTVMPDPRDSGYWRESFREEHGAEGESPAFAFVTLERV